MNVLKRTYHWMGMHVHSPYATPVLALFFFIESSIFFVPVDPLLILYCVEHRNRVWYYATIATIASVIGGLFGYVIGFLLWQTIGQFIVHYIISPTIFNKVVQSFTRYESIAVLFAAISPIPYKAVTIGAGFCKLPLIPFIIFSIIGRGFRFYALAGIIYIWGEQIKEFIDRYFNILVLLFLILVFGGMWLIT